MADLDWRKTPDGRLADGYRIRRLDTWPPQWRLESSRDWTPWLGSSAPTLSNHSTLRDAMERAVRGEKERIRRARVTGHIVLGAAASLGFIAVLSTTLAHSVTGFVAAIVLFYLALRSSTDAVGVWLGDPWGWTRDKGGPERLTWTGRCVLAFMEGARRRNLASTSGEPPAPVRTLPPARVDD